MTIVQPEWYCPFEPKLSQNTAASSAQTSRWAADFGLAELTEIAPKTAQFTRLVGYFYPSASPERFQLLSDWTTWLFLHDDVCDDTGAGRAGNALAARLEHLFAVLVGDVPGEQPVERALEDLRHRFRALAPTRGWFFRFLTTVRDYFDACIWEAHNRERAVTPAVNLFINMRRLASDMWSYIEFIDFVRGDVTPVWKRRHRDMEVLASITNNVASWTNDVFSAAKEIAQSVLKNLAQDREVGFLAAHDRASRLPV